MEENESRAQDIRRLRRLLNDLTQLAEHSSLTGALESGLPRAVRRYNAALEQLEGIGAVPEGLFEPLDESACFDDLGVDSRLLAGYLTADEGAEMPLSPRERRQLLVGGISVEDLSALRDLGRLVRENMPVWMKGRGPAGHSHRHGPHDPPAPPVPPVPPVPPAPPSHFEAIIELEEAQEMCVQAQERASDAEERLADAESRMKEMEERLREAQQRLADSQRNAGNST